MWPKDLFHDAERTVNNLLTKFRLLIWMPQVWEKGTLLNNALFSDLPFSPKALRMALCCFRFGKRSRYNLTYDFLAGLPDGLLLFAAPVRFLVDFAEGAVNESLECRVHALPAGRNLGLCLCCRRGEEPFPRSHPPAASTYVASSSTPTPLLLLLCTSCLQSAAVLPTLLPPSFPFFPPVAFNLRNPLRFLYLLLLRFAALNYH